MNSLAKLTFGSWEIVTGQPRLRDAEHLSEYFRETYHFWKRTETCVMSRCDTLSRFTIFPLTYYFVIAASIMQAVILILQLRLGYLCVWIAAKFSIWVFRYVGIILSVCNRMVSGWQSLIACRRSVCSSVSGKCLIMSNPTLFVNGSIHQGHERFSDISRGRQCSFMSFSVLLFAQSVAVRP